MAVDDVITTTATSTFSINVIGCIWEGILDNLTSTTTVSDLKLILCPRTNLITHQQLLFLVKPSAMMTPLNQPELDMEHYGVKDGDKVWLYSPFLLAKLIIPSLGLSEDVKICDTDLMIEVKEFVMVRYGLSEGLVSLCCAGVVMEDSDCLRDFEFDEDNVEIYVIVRKEGKAAGGKMVLVADVDGVGEFEISVLESFTVKDAKTVVESVSSLPVSLQDLMLGDRLLCNRDTVMSCGLKDMMVVTVLVRASKDLTWNIDDGEERGEGKVLNKSSSTLQDLKSVMLWFEETKRPGHELALYLDGSTKMEPHKLLANYILNKNSWVGVEQVIRITVGMPGGGIRGVDVKKWYTVGHVKKLIEKLCDIPCWMQKLNRLGDEECIIPDSTKLSDCEKEYGGFSSLRWNKKWSFFFPTYTSSDENLEKAVDNICNIMLSQKMTNGV